MRQPKRAQIANYFVYLGVLAMLWSLITITSGTYIVIINSVIGGVLLIYIASQLRLKRAWARDILLVFTLLMTLMAIFTLLGGFSLLWVVIGAVSLFLLWGLKDL